eukprot:scaffold2612_cov267-Chaetoceros_neogracile.AAC.7
MNLPGAMKEDNEVFSRFYTITDRTKQGQIGFFRCFLNCIPRLNSITNTESRRPPNPEGGVLVPPAIDSTDGSQVSRNQNDQQYLLEEFEEFIRDCAFNDYHLIQQNEKGDHVEDGPCAHTDLSLNRSTEVDDSFSLCPTEGGFSVDYTFDYDRYGRDSFDNESYCMKEDASDISGWVPFESLSYSSKVQKSSMKPSLPRTPLKNNIHSESQGTPATEVSIYSTNSTDDDDDDDECDRDKDRKKLIMIGKTVSLDLPSFDLDEGNAETEGANAGNGQIVFDDDDRSSGSDLSQSVSHANGRKSDISSSNGHNSRDPPRPLRQRKEIDNFLEQNERISSSLHATATTKGEGLSHYISVFYPDDDIDSLNASIPESDEDESCYKETFDDIGSNNREFDNLYHAEMSSI